MGAAAGVVGQEVPAQTMFRATALHLLRPKDFRRLDACA